MNKLFLTAEWRKLVMVNYLVEPDLLNVFLPAKTEIDNWNNQCYVSLVAFRFVNTVVRGCRIPFHTDFEEVNLRFYVRYKDEGIWKRGVVFIREFVPLPMVTFVANTLYQEQYRTIPMRHQWQIAGEWIKVQYEWKVKTWQTLQVEARNQPELIREGSEEEFITQHFWGYSRKSGNTSEYHVEHELWHSYPVETYHLDVDYERCYGSVFSFLNHSDPHSVYLVEGSPVKVFKDRII